MSDIKWIKIDTGLFNNRKIRQIERLGNSDALIVIWLKMLILAAEVNEDGYLYFTDSVPYDAELMATQFDRPIELIVEALDTFVKYDMIEKSIIEMDTIYRISNWEKYQNAYGMERIREQNRLRKQRQRERERDISEDDNNTVTCDSHAESRDGHGTDKDKDKEKDKNIKKSTRTTFKPPTVDEVKAYCLERDNKVDAQTFIDFYAAKGWMIGTNKMKDWRACVRTWEKRVKDNAQPIKNKGTSQMHNFKQNSYNFNDLEAKIMESQRQAEKRHKC